MAIDGTYNVTMTTPMGPQQAKLTLKCDGSSLSGTYESAMGPEEFSGGTINGNRCEWNATTKTPMGPLSLKISAIVEGNRISGQAVSPFGTATFEGSKV
ncbi:MAG: hypothetical protein ABSH25_11510 [Syntrophorhabdales bacterium]|jgi:hypothetical protein